jgi:hypothetical protein
MSGMSLSDVSIHTGDGQAEAMGAEAYAKGSEVHLGAGGEKHLGHELWHVVQQKQGRVKPTEQVAGQAVNSDPKLEAEADVMGARAQSAASSGAGPTAQLREASAAGVVQRKVTVGTDLTVAQVETALRASVYLPSLLPEHSLTALVTAVFNQKNWSFKDNAGMCATLGPLVDADLSPPSGYALYTATSGAHAFVKDPFAINQVAIDHLLDRSQWHTSKKMQGAAVGAPYLHETNNTLYLIDDSAPATNGVPTLELTKQGKVNDKVHVF